MSSASATVTDPADLGVAEAAALLAARRLSAVELTEACLRRIATRDGGLTGDTAFHGAPDVINAWARVYHERALAAARAADARRARDGDATDPLCGVPLGLKDIYGVAGLPLTASSRVLQANVAAADATVWARLRDRGMVLLGHTHTHEFAAGGTTDQVGNPWALDRIAGGSSGGSAAAVAARMAPAALGSDTCGSLRIPSACCGVSALKPTHGRLPIDGMIPLAPSLDHPGPIARTIADCALLLSAMADGGGPVDPASPPAAPLPALPVRARPGPRPLSGVTVAVLEPDVAPAVADGLARARSACERLGARVVPATAPWAIDWDALNRVLLTEVAAHHAAYAGADDRYRPSIAEFVQAGRGFTDARAYLDAQAVRARGAAAWERWLSTEGVDLVLEPTLPVLPLDRGPGYERGHAGGAGDPLIALTALWDMTGMPVAALPVRWDVGVSLVAARGAEAALTAAAIDLQEHELGVPWWAP